MPRLPIPGQDAGTWGDLLNEYLQQALKPDGTIKDNAVTANNIAPNSITATQIASNTITAAVIQDGSITEAQLDAAAQAKLNAVGSGSVADDTISTAKLQDGAVATVKLADSAVTDAKVAAGAAIAQSKIANLTSDLAGKAATSHTHTASQVSDSTSIGRSILTAADAAAVRTAIGAGTSSLVIGTTAATAKAGDYAPTKSDVGLANVDNTSDVNKPISTAVQTALDLKAASSHTHTASAISDSTVTGRAVMTATDAAAARSAIGAGTSSLVLGTTSTTAKAGDYAPTKSDVGLGNVDNTSDANKPISSATQTALNLKAPLANPTFTGVVTVPTPTNSTDAATKAYVDANTGGSAGDFTFINHAADDAASRTVASGAAGFWVGSVEPTNALDGDVWLDTSGSTPSVTTTVLNSLGEGILMNAQILVATGSTPITWTVTGGTLPTGLMLSSAGELSGTPDSAGAYDFTVTATNGYGTSNQQYTGTISGGTAPTIATTILSAAAQDAAFSQTLSATGSTPITWSVAAGTIIPGLSLSSAGVLSGTPSGSGAYDFTVSAVNSYGSDDQQYTGTVSGATAPVITTTSLTTLTQSAAFSQTLSATGSVPITWSVTAGTLPAGLALNASTGAVTGTPSGSGAYDFTITATNSAGSDNQQYTGTIGAAVPVTVSSVGAAASVLLLSGGSTYTFNHTTVGANEVVELYMFTDRDTTFSAVTIGGASMTYIERLTFGTPFNSTGGTSGYVARYRATVATAGSKTISFTTSAPIYVGFTSVGFSSNAATFGAMAGTESTGVTTASRAITVASNHVGIGLLVGQSASASNATFVSPSGGTAIAATGYVNGAKNYANTISRYSQGADFTISATTNTNMRWMTIEVIVGA